MIVLGIDPGASNMGFGVVERRGARLLALDGGAIETPPGMALERRLALIHARLAELIAEHRPAAMALEDLYFGHNVRSALSVGQARGVAVLAAGLSDLECFHYTPQAIKKAVCGAGNAQKDQVQRMVQALLSLTDPPRPDHAADALAVAICHLGSMGVRAAVDNRAMAAKQPLGAAR